MARCWQFGAHCRLGGCSRRRERAVRRERALAAAWLAAIAGLCLVQGCDAPPAPGGQSDQPRIVSLSPSVTEMLFALEAEDLLVGVTDRCNYPAGAQQIECVGGFGSPNVERLLAISPDLVIATGRKRTDAGAVLQRAGIRVLWLKTDTVALILDALQEVGRHVGKRKQAQQLAANMQAELDAIAEEHRHVPVDRRPRVFVEVWNQPITTAGKGSYVDELIRRAGGVNVAQGIESAYPTLNPEMVLEWNPDVILLAYMSTPQAEESFARRIGWHDVAAVRSGSVIDDMSPDLLLRPGPRLVEGVRELSQRLQKLSARHSPEP